MRASFVCSDQSLRLRLTICAALITSLPISPSNCCHTGRMASRQACRCSAVRVMIWLLPEAVSYTHLTLPTILLV